MNQDVQPQNSPPVSPAGVVAPPAWTWLSFFLIAPFVLWVGFSIGQKTTNVGLANGPKDPDPVEVLPNTMFRGWADPEMVIVFSGQTYGYLQPCGCSNPQDGGLARRYNFIQMLKKRGWPVEAIDIGELYPKRDPKKLAVAEQEKEKFRTSLKALTFMGYRAYAVGASELTMPLANGLAEAGALNLKDAPSPLLTNLDDPNKIFAGFGGRQVLTFGNRVKVGVANVVAPSLAKKFADDPNLKFHAYDLMLEPVMEHFAKENVDVSIVLLQANYDFDPARPAAILREYALELERYSKSAKEKKLAKGTLKLIDVIGHVSHEDNPAGQLVPIPERDAKGDEIKFDAGRDGECYVTLAEA